MSRTSRIGGIVLSFLCLALAVAAEEKSPPAAAAAAQPAAPLCQRPRPGENVTLATLDNGLTVIVQENHVAPVATVRCYVKNTGSAFEGATSARG